MEIVTEPDYDAINEDEVKEFLEKRANQLKLDVPIRDIKDILLNILKVIKENKGEIKPTNTGLLFFGKNPSIFIPQNEIRIARFKGVTKLETIDSQEIKGPIYKMLDEVESFFGGILVWQIKLLNLSVSTFRISMKL
jgi:predicted HTH transcriptional regulator